MIRIHYGLWVIGCSLLLIGCSRVKKTEEETERAIVLNNKIKSSTEYIAIFHLGIEEKEQLHCIKLFNTKGLCIKETAFITNDSIESIVIHEYDKNDNLILTKGIKPDSSFIFKETRTYDDKNNRKELYFYLPDGTYKYRNTATYDKEGRRIELDWFWITGLKAKNKYKYDGSKKVEDVEYNPDGKFQYVWKYKYDEKRNLTEAVQYYPGSVINSKVVYEYSLADLLVKQSNFFLESVQNVVTYEYDDKNLLSAKTEFSSTQKISARYRYKYEFRPS